MATWIGAGRVRWARSGALWWGVLLSVSLDSRSISEIAIMSPFNIRGHLKYVLYHSSTLIVLPISSHLFYATSHLNSLQYKYFCFLSPCITRQKYCYDSNNSSFLLFCLWKRKYFAGSLSWFIFTMPCHISVFIWGEDFKWMIFCH